MMQSEKTNLKIAGVDYPMAWSLSVYKEFKRLTGRDYNGLASALFNEVNELQLALGKPPILHSNLKDNSEDNYTVFYTENEFKKALDLYTITFDMEFTKRVTSVFDADHVAALFYAAANDLNSKVLLEEMEENVFIEGTKPTNNKTGYQYLLFQFMTWVANSGGKGEVDEKKSSKGSLLERLVSSLTT